MRYRYPLSARLTAQAVQFTEFANGGAQCHAKLRDGTFHSGILISNSAAIVAMRGYRALPFTVDHVDHLYQDTDDRNPTERDGWDFFDDWGS
jgi:hypothetical protein